jgi:hypothetical protein
VEETAMIAAYIDEFIMLCAGLWMTAVGFRYISFPIPGPGEKNAWLANIVNHFRWMGPLLVIIAVILAIAAPA